MACVMDSAVERLNCYSLQPRVVIKYIFSVPELTPAELKLDRAKDELAQAFL